MFSRTSALIVAEGGFNALMLGESTDAALRREQAVLLVALYLRGLSRSVLPQVRLWPMVLKELQRHEAGLAEAVHVLQAANLEAEALCLQSEALLDVATEHVFSRKCLTAVHPKYPCRWLERLGPRAQPAMWWNGIPFKSGPTLTCVGSRAPGGAVLEAMESLAYAAALEGFVIVSGGAIGCDSAAARGARRAIGEGATVEILPCGLANAEHDDRPLLSVCAPHAGFTSAQAMERNTLLYAASPLSLVGHARFREGGTWIGATTALRHRQSRVILLPWGEDLAFRSLCALGAKPFTGSYSPECYDADAQTPLFDVAPVSHYGVHELRAGYAA